MQKDEKFEEEAMKPITRRFLRPLCAAAAVAAIFAVMPAAAEEEQQ